MKYVWLIFLNFVLIGCTTFKHMEEGLQDLVGSDIKTAYNILGYPSDVKTINEDKIYVWDTSSSGVMLMPQSSTTTGYVGNTMYSGTTNYNQVMPFSYNCKIRLITNSIDLIKSWDYNGNLGGCENWIKKLKSHKEGNS